MEELAFTPVEEVAAIEGFDDSVAEELIRRAETFLTRRDTELNDKRIELGVTDEVAAFEAFTPAMLVALGEKGVKTLDDLGDLASDELIEIVGAEQMDEETANAVIMAARAHWFDDEDAAARRRRPTPLRPRRSATTDTDASSTARSLTRTMKSRKQAQCAAAWLPANACRRSKCFDLSSVPIAL